MTSVVNLQALLIGMLLLWAGSLKLLGSSTSSNISQSALAQLIRRPKVTQAVYYSLGVMELGVAVLLLLPPQYRWEMSLASGLMMLFLVYLIIVLRIAPERSCGCLGDSNVPISWHNVVRAGLLLGITLFGRHADQFWLTALVANPWSLSVIGLEGIVLLTLSPEVRWPWQRQTNSIALPDSSSDEVDCTVISIPVTNTLQQLRTSDLFLSLAVYLRSELREHWREGCWRYLCFEAEYEGVRATAIFAVPVVPRPEWIRAAIINEADNAILLSAAPTT